MQNLEVELTTEKKEALRNKIGTTIRCRSHFYPEDYYYFEKEYIDTTHYDKNTYNLDVGYQHLKIFRIKQYPILAGIRSLFIDHNSLKELPKPADMPNLVELTAHSNKLTFLYYYPKLKLLNIADNFIDDMKDYHNSKLEYVDISNNYGIKININLPNCIRFYANKCGFKSFDFGNCKNLRIADLSENKIEELKSKDNILDELHCQNNNLTSIPTFSKLRRLNADHNNIEILATQPELVSLSICHNRLKKLPKLPKLIKLIANNNNIEQVDVYSELELVDLGHNKLTSFTINNLCLYVSLEFNRIEKLKLSKNLSKIKELQIDMGLYDKIYKDYFKYFSGINIQVNMKILELILDKIDLFDESVCYYLMKKFCKINFKTRDNQLLQIAMSIYWKIFGKTKAQSEDAKYIEYVCQKKEFKNLMKNLYVIYYRCISVCIFFNEYSG